MKGKAGVTVLLFSVLLLIVACEDQSSTSAIVTVPQDNTTTNTTSVSVKPVVTLAEWNIQVFGLAKSSNPELLKKIADRISKYDLVVIQEVRDSSGTAILNLLDALESGRDEWDVVVSPRLGRSSYKEQYAIYYRKDVFKPGKFKILQDPSDHFEREPMIVNFTVGNWTFTLITAHLQPSKVQVEMVDLMIYATSIQKFPVVVLGDLNADCDYWDEDNNKWWYWVIPNTADTTASNGTNCTYDRIIVNTEMSFHYFPIEEWGVEQVSLDESDHNLVWAKFVTNENFYKQTNLKGKVGE